MNDNAADGTTMEPENQQKGRGMKRKFTERKNYFSGFCVVCEKELLRIRDHKEDTHKDTGQQCGADSDEGKLEELTASCGFCIFFDEISEHTNRFLRVESETLSKTVLKFLT
ncbi:Hypothetical predicted protein [Cloeon dipterum]|uniref:Uncharacterized protein n=1 Tax=Cloeon dipterum TaxID=197152 RepID=A0A8S1DTT1_9INSE|nr:Hypothetical predicted protein [Cloeon dipterum]